MNINLICVGKTQEAYLREGIRIYQARLAHYVTFQCIEINDIKNSAVLTRQQIKEREGEALFKACGPNDYMILFDAAGTMRSSEEMAAQLARHQQVGTKTLSFLIGGPYGFSPQVYARAREQWSLSPLTFSHQMVRLLCIEQLYRCFTIIKGEPYHHA